MRLLKANIKFLKTKKILSLLLFLGIIFLIVYRILYTQNLKTIPEYENIFSELKVLDLKIKISEPDYQEMILNSAQKNFKPADVEVNKDIFKNSAVKIKSVSTVKNYTEEKNIYSFIISFNKYQKENLFHGLDSLTLNSCVADISYMREFLANEAMRKIGGKAPLTTFANLYINDEYIGLYSCSETISTSFLNRNFGNTNGNLFKANNDANLIYKKDFHYPYVTLESGSDELLLSYKNLIESIDNLPVEDNIESILDVGSVLQYIALNTLISNYYSYNGPLASNYYFYEKDGIFHMLLSEPYLAFDAYMPRTIRSNESLTEFLKKSNTENIPIDTPIFQTQMLDRPLIDNLLKIPKYREKYYSYLNELIKYFENFEKRTSEISKVLLPHIEKSEKPLHSKDLFENSINPKYEKAPTNLRNYYYNYSVSKKSIVNFINKRIENVKKQLSGDSPKPKNETIGGYLN